MMGDVRVDGSVANGYEVVVATWPELDDDRLLIRAPAHPHSGTGDGARRLTHQLGSVVGIAGLGVQWAVARPSDGLAWAFLTT